MDFHFAYIRDWAKPLGDLDAARAWLAGHNDCTLLLFAGAWLASSNKSRSRMAGCSPFRISPLKVISPMYSDCGRQASGPREWNAAGGIERFFRCVVRCAIIPPECSFEGRWWGYERCLQSDLPIMSFGSALRLALPADLAFGSRRA